VPAGPESLGPMLPMPRSRLQRVWMEKLRAAKGTSRGLDPVYQGFCSQEHLPPKCHGASRVVVPEDLARPQAATMASVNAIRLSSFRPLGAVPNELVLSPLD